MSVNDEGAAALTPAEIAELNDRVAKAEAAAKAAKELAEQAEKRAAEEAESRRNVVEELKALREKKADPGATNANPEDVQSQVEAALQRQRQKDAESNRKIAIASFQQAHKEFHPDNDPGGLKFKAVTDEFNLFDTSSAYSAEEFSAFLDRAKRLVLGSNADGDREVITDDPSLISGTVAPKSDKATKLTKAEIDAIKQVGWTEDRYLKLKGSNPDYVRSLLGL